MATKETNYTEAQVARMHEFEFIDANIAKMLAAEFNKNEKSVIAKAVRENLYRAKQRTTKSGEAIERKEAIVAEIGQLVGANMEGLEKASKEALKAIRASLRAAA